MDAGGWMPELQVAWQMCADVKPSCCRSSYHSALLFYMGAVGGLNIHTLFDHLFFSFCPGTKLGFNYWLHAHCAQ